MTDQSKVRRSEVRYEDRGSVLAPLKNLQFLFRPPVTESLEPRPAAAIYRGFHLNDWNACIGCGSCQKMCDNAAISMVRVPGAPEDPVRGIRPLRPAIDYGRCCWCALCVDICPTEAIKLSREYVHTCTEEEIDSYFMLPDEHGLHGTPFPTGWTKTPTNDLLDLARQPMPELPPDERLEGFREMVLGYDDEQALIEASRCVQCGLCHDACPTHMHAPEYIRAIWRGEPEEAVRWMYRTNPFSHVCGRVCTHRCEAACAVGRRGEPVAIRWLKRYAMDRVPHERIKEIAAEGRADYVTGRSVAIVGAGPAGLTAAYDLVKKGHRVVVFEALPKPGGMTRYGIPSYRLPEEILDREVEVIESLGVEIRCNTRVGRDVSMDELHERFDAVVLAVGLQMGRSTRVPGADHEDVKRAVDLLREVGAGRALEVPETAVVIGGGNVAMDIARTLARFQRRRHGRVRVTVVALEDFDHFLADPVEVKEAREEGIEILDSRGPREVVVEDGRVRGLVTWRVRSVFDEKGRFAPELDPEDERFHEGAWVVEAIGQTADMTLLGEALMERLEWRRGRLQVDDEGRTALPWLWAAGDDVHGPDVVHAVADGHRVAESIDRCLTRLEKSP